MKARIGIIGCGQIVKIRHAPELFACKQAEVAGFYDFFPERAKEYADQYGGVVYADYKDMIADPNVDGVVICTSNDSHAAISIEALEAGKYVLCEKPMATNQDEAMRMIEADEKSDAFFMAAHNQRFTLAHRKAKVDVECLASYIVLTGKRCEESPAGSAFPATAEQVWTHALKHMGLVAFHYIEC